MEKLEKKSFLGKINFLLENAFIFPGFSFSFLPKLGDYFSKSLMELLNKVEKLSRSPCNKCSRLV